MHPFHLTAARAAFCWIVFALSVAAVWAEAPSLTKVTRVTVTKNDGKTVNGELMESTPAGLTLKPAVKGDAVLVPWATIKKTSNGLTHADIVTAWRAAHADKLCETCTGQGTVKCDVCNGTGIDPAQAKSCDKCKGTGDLGKCPKCTDGKVPCPNTCLKASMFANLPVQPDGKKHKTFHNRDGSTQWWSEFHVGDLVVQENGMWVDKGKCPLCNGTGLTPCPTCHGSAKRECTTCHGAGVVGPPCTAGCGAGQVACKTCAGTGLKPSAAAQPTATGAG